MFRLVCWAMRFKVLFSWLGGKYSFAFGKDERKPQTYKFDN